MIITQKTVVIHKTTKLEYALFPTNNRGRVILTCNDGRVPGSHQEINIETAAAIFNIK